jgi:hypothetical protein
MKRTNFTTGQSRSEDRKGKRKQVTFAATVRDYVKRENRFFFFSLRQENGKWVIYLLVLLLI